jgi:tRNA(Ile)-lysidine synthase
MMRTLAILKEENDYLDQTAEEVSQKIVQEKDETFSFIFSEYQSLHRTIQRRLIQKVIGKIYDGAYAMEEKKRVATEFVFKRLSQPSPSFLIELPDGVSFEKQYDRVFLRKERVNPIPPFEIELRLSGSTFIEEIGKKAVVEEIERGEKIDDLKGSSNIAFLDYQNLQFPLRMRNFRPGDRFQPLGAKGTQKLKEFFIDHKIPRFERPKIPLLVSGEMIAWIVGYRIDERVKITEKTQKVVKVEVV